jgi:uncharacterized protein
VVISSIIAHRSSCAIRFGADTIAAILSEKATGQRMKPNFEQAKHYVFERLARELSPDLTYHSLQHTRDDVLPAAIRLGRASAVSPEDCLVLTTAALFHDTGFLLAYDEHEQRSINVARAALPGFGYSADQIQTIAELIAATKMPQRPNGKLQQLLCDADLDLLGRDDFMRLNRVLLDEVRRYSVEPITEEAWLRDQTRFLENHKFFTPAAVKLRGAGQAHNLSLMRAALASLNGSGANSDGIPH